MKRFGLMAMLLLACSRDVSAPPPVEPAPVPVTSVAVVREAIAEPVLGTGSIVADKATEIGPRVSGIVEAVHVDVGSVVRAGDPLFTTRTVDYRLRLAEAEQALKLARAEAENARRRLERVEQLFAQQVASQGHLDDARTAHEMAAARAGGVESAHAMASQALADTVVRAPYPGVITRRYVDEGTMLSAQMGSSPVVQIIKTDRVEAVVQVPEVHLARVAPGTRARVQVDGVARTFEAEIGVVNDQIDATARAFEVRIPIDNAEAILKPGLFARAELLPEPRDALVLPRGALQGAPGERFVFVAAGERARRRQLETRELDAARIEVVAGLDEGEVVLFGPNLPKLSEGARVALEVARADR